MATLAAAWGPVQWILVILAVIIVIVLIVLMATKKPPQGEDIQPGEEIPSEPISEPEPEPEPEEEPAEPAEAKEGDEPEEQ